MKIITVIGARPQFIKASAFSKSAKASGVSEILVHTGQHYDKNMSDIFFDELGIPAPQYHLGIGSGSHGAQTGEMLAKIEEVILKERPDWLLVYGDTNSTLAGALAASKLHIKVAHVEAGLRSFNKRMPEEINRILTDHVSTALFVPTASAVRHLQAEGIQGNAVHLVGDVMFDVSRIMADRARTVSTILETLGVQEGGFVLSTIHRAENTDVPSRLSAVVGGLREVAQEIPVVLPLHPRTRKIAGELGLDFGSIQVIEPIGYLDMVRLEQSAALIATDSGGVQKEAYFYGVPCVTLRDETEWTELIESGWNTLTPPVSAEVVKNSIMHQMNTVGKPELLYGDGHAANKILKLMEEWIQ
ncbi:non-hydrolyzing UDP-N-acetylglucosamine 2-epimerase [Deinococcus knuensis]|uniref:UDP-N-acetyl glucosamine 2-epimerase n=1 Tax=Deinococcus knuensis TaxID=1837380 RepID=A0ABQ2SPY9_9DEIO|nr:UDP-N-acetylglucosamine 2-epimerase (non-hydrolyzing) [Deinococcus knuensis]GGS36158.1 UDP-N-acetyl glucosamine 2-epimerase [Deinococcus knuensis]